MSDTTKNTESKGLTTKSVDFDKSTADNPQQRARTSEQAKTPSAGQQARHNPAESGDPAVHQLLAERQTANMNGDEAAVQRIDHELDKLGFGG